MRKLVGFVLILIGLLDSLYLWWVYTSPFRPLVCIGSGCDEVRASRFAQLWGLPVPAFGAGLYLLLMAMMFAETLIPESFATWSRHCVVFLAGAGVLVSAGLTWVEAFVIRAWCVWCVVQAVAIMLVFVLSLSSLRISFRDRTSRLAAARRYLTIVTLAAIVAPVSFGLLQRYGYSHNQPTTLTASEALRLIRKESHVTGNVHSPVTFVEFGDFQCPACVRVAPTVQELRRRFGNRVRFVFRHFPLESIHLYAVSAAEASECAALQGNFWGAVDRFYESDGILDPASLQKYVSDLGLDASKYRACMDNKNGDAQVQRDILDGVALGVRSTPTFFIGDKRLVGVVPLSTFVQMLNDDLASARVLSASEPPSVP